MTKLRGMYQAPCQSCLAAAHPSFYVMLGRKGPMLSCCHGHGAGWVHCHILCQAHGHQWFRVLILVGFLHRSTKWSLCNTEYDQTAKDHAAWSHGRSTCVCVIRVNGTVSSSLCHLEKSHLFIRKLCSCFCLLGNPLFDILKIQIIFKLFAKYFCWSLFSLINTWHSRKCKKKRQFFFNWSYRASLCNLLA